MTQIKKWCGNHEVLLSILVLVVIGLIAYVPTMKNAGFYSDDYHMIYGAYTSGPEKIQESYQIDRPGAGFTLRILTAWFGLNIHYFQALVIVLYILTSLCTYWLMGMLWPEQKGFAFTVAVLAEIYPGFIEGMRAFNFSLFLLSIFLYVFSIALTIKVLKVKNRGIKSFFILVAMASAVWAVLLNEYYLGLEVFRIGVLFVYLKRNQAETQKRPSLFVQTLKAYIPYLISTTAFFVWRFFIFTSQRAATNLGSFVGEFTQSPFYKGMSIIRGLIENFLNITFVAWFEPVYRAKNSLRLKDYLVLSLVALVGFLIVYLVLKLNKSREGEKKAGRGTWTEMLVLGVITVVGTSLPIVFVNRSVTFADYGKYSLSGMIGGVIVLSALLYHSVKPELRSILIAFLVFCGMLVQLTVGKGLASDWSGSKELWWQLSWRAPSLKAGTLLTGRVDSYSIGEGFNLWGPANMIYYPDQTNPVIYGEVLNSELIQTVMQDKDISRDFRSYLLEMDTKNLLVLSKPSQYSCVHVIDGAAPDYSIYDSSDTLVIGEYSKIDQIDVSAIPSAPPEEIFGAEPEHGWCYYYQKSELALQQKDYPEVVRLYKEAGSKDLKPEDASEYVPFILALAETGDEAELKQIFPIFLNYPFHKVTYCENLIQQRYGISAEANQKLIELSCMNEYLASQE